MGLHSSMVVSNIFYVHPYLGKWSYLTIAYFSDELVQPPTGHDFCGSIPWMLVRQPATNCGSEAPAVIGKGVSIIVPLWRPRTKTMVWTLYNRCNSVEWWSSICVGYFDPNPTKEPKCWNLSPSWNLSKGPFWKINQMWVDIQSSHGWYGCLYFVLKHQSIRCPVGGIRTCWSFQDTCGQSGGSQGVFFTASPWPAVDKKKMAANLLMLQKSGE